MIYLSDHFRFFRDPSRYGIDNRDDTIYDTIMPRRQVVIDTNVFVAALRSQLGAAYRLIMMVGTDRFEINLSVPLVLEYEAIAKRQADELGLDLQGIEEIIGYFCLVANQHKIHYLWRPILPDPKDDMILELAVAAQCQYIVTYNQKDFRGAERFGISVITPQRFLQEIGELT